MIDNPFVITLLLAGKGIIEACGSCSPMLTGIKDDEEKLTLILPSEPTSHDNLIRYMQGFTLALYSGVDHVYELRDVFMSQTDEGEEPLLRPSEDPAAINALHVIQLTVSTGEQTTYAQKYVIGDQGQAIFSDVEVLDGEISGPYADTAQNILSKWKASGSETMPPQQVEVSRLQIGFLGRVKGATP